MSYFRVDARQWTDRQLVHILAHVFGMDSRTKRKVGCCRCGSIFRDCVCEREGDEARVPVYVAVFEHDGDLEVGPRYERRRQIWRQEGEGAMQIYWAKKAADGHALESEKWFRLC